VTRQSIYLEDSSTHLVTDELIAYDPVTMTVSLSNPSPPLAWLTAGQKYRVVVNVPSFEGGTSAGLLAIDGATLAAPVTLVFTAGAPADPPFAGPPSIPFCGTVLDGIFKQDCSFCHTRPQDAGLVTLPDAGFNVTQPPLGLDLSSAEGVRSTAVGQVADESNTGPLARPATPSLGEPFGIDMPILAPGEPGNSWLLYKVILANPAPADAETIGGDSGVVTYGQGTKLPASQAELGRLAAYILGQAMPYQVPGQGTNPTLTAGDLVRLSTWIAQGAITPTSCPP